MSMYQFQKTFEQSLRSPSTNVTTTIETTPLKTEIHRGCTGKAHACGTIKNRVVKLREIKESNQRKNSLSSETISDSGSEISNIEGPWGEKPTFTRSLSKPRNSLPLPPSTSTNNQSIQINHRNGIHSQRRRTIENVVSIDEADKSINNNNNKFNSDSGLNTDDENANCALNRNGHRRSFRKSTTPTRPPWQNVYSKPSTTSHSPSPVQRTNSLRSSFRSSSFRRKGDNWNTLWLKSFGLRYGGGVCKTLEALLLEKVNDFFIIIFLFIPLFVYVLFMCI